MKTFLKANIASLLATGFDYTTAILAFRMTGTNVLWSSFAGNLAGGILHFSLSRSYVFSAARQPVSIQALRYLIIWAGNMLLNVLFVYVLAEICGIHFLLSKIGSSILVFTGFNYPLQRWFVFKTMEQK